MPNFLLEAKTPHQNLANHPRLIFMRKNLTQSIFVEVTIYLIVVHSSFDSTTVKTLLLSITHRDSKEVYIGNRNIYE